MLNYLNQLLTIDKNKNKYTEVYSLGKIFRFFIIKEKKNIIKYKAFIIGLYQFEGECHINDLNILAKYIDLYEEDGVDLLCVSEDICENIKFEEFPVKNIIYLFTTEGTQGNYLQFYNSIIKAMDEKEIIDDRSSIIVSNLKNNRDKYKEFFHKIDCPLNNWIFNNKSINLKYNYFDTLKTFAHLDKDIEKGVFPNYYKLNSFQELMNYLTYNKDISFKKELEQFVSENMMYQADEFTIVNFILFEKILSVMCLSDTPKDFKEFKICLNRINSIFLGKDRSIINNDLNFKEHFKTFCESFKESPIEVLKKSNIPFHLFEKKNQVLSKYYSLYTDKISIKKEKKLAYFMDELSKRLSKDINHFDFELKNEGFNHENFNFKIDKIQIKSIDSSKELFDLGIKMANCLGQFENLEDYSSDRINFFAQKENELFVGYIKDGIFKEFKGFKNASPSIEFMSKVFDELYRKGYLKHIDDHNGYDSLYSKECIFRLNID